MWHIRTWTRYNKHCMLGSVMIIDVSFEVSVSLSHISYMKKRKTSHPTIVCSLPYTVCHFILTDVRGYMTLIAHHLKYNINYGLPTMAVTALCKTIERQCYYRSHWAEFIACYQREQLWYPARRHPTALCSSWQIHV